MSGLFSGIGWTGTLMTLVALWAAPVSADTVDARCDIYPRGEDHATATVLCTFSQRQGHVRIQRQDGVAYDFTPTGDAPGNYLDAAGRAAYRQSGLGKDGLIFRTGTESIFVYWSTAGMQGTGDGSESATSPYSTAEYDATTLLSCSQGAPTHDGTCAAGILRGAAGEASIRVTGPGGRERVLNFTRDDVTTPDGGRLTWGKQGDDWYIGIDDQEFYRVPVAAIEGG